MQGGKVQSSVWSQILEDWDLETCIKSLDLVEATIRSAAQDSSSETRSIGRSMFAAYLRAMPHRGQAFLRRMDTSLQEKLSQAILTYVPGQPSSSSLVCIVHQWSVAVSMNEKYAACKLLPGRTCTLFSHAPKAIPGIVVDHSKSSWQTSCAKQHQ